MKVYYDDKFVTLLLGDCRTVLQEIQGNARDFTRSVSPPGSLLHEDERPVALFDFLVTDPPYGNVTRTKGDWDIYPKGALKQAWRHTSQAALVFWNAFDLTGDPPAVRFSRDEENPEGRLKNVIAWVKPNRVPHPMFDKSRFSACWEPILYHARKGFLPAKRNPSDVWTFNYPRTKVHPTEKPLDLMIHALRVLGRGTYLDPFAGSGTTLVAAKRLGFRAVGIEIEEKFAEVAAGRISQASLLPVEEVHGTPLQGTFS